MASPNPDIIATISNEINFCKYLLLINEPCTLALFYVYKWLYSWKDNKPECLADHLDDVPAHNSVKGRLIKNYLKLREDEENIVKKMKNDSSVLRNLDLNLFYKVSLVACFP